MYRWQCDAVIKVSLGRHTESASQKVRGSKLTRLGGRDEATTAAARRDLHQGYERLAHLPSSSSTILMRYSSAHVVLSRMEYILLASLFICASGGAALYGASLPHGLNQTENSIACIGRT